MTFPKNAEHTINGGWYVCTVTYEPTEFDATGCDGMYVKSVRIKWWGYPIGWALSFKRWLLN